MAPTLRQIGIFAKYWAPGAVKTRLAAHIGPEAAAGIAHGFLCCLVDRLSALPYAKQMGYSPADQLDAFKHLAPGWTFRPQCAGDLGARMTDYFQGAFEQGMERVLLLGADCPTIPTTHLHNAFARLDDCDVVIAPAHDGGYCLIAAREQSPPLFDHGRWGDETVLERTLDLAERRNINVAMLDPWLDVDEWEDLVTLADFLAQQEIPAYEALHGVLLEALEQTE